MPPRSSTPSGADDRTKDEFSEQMDRLQDLHRKYRVMDGNRKAYTEQTQNIIRKQTQSIENLQKENERLRLTLSEEALDGAAQYKAMGSRDIRNLEDRIDGYQDKCDREERTADELTKEIKILQRKLLELRREAAQRKQTNVTPQMVEHQIRVLENRLEQSYVKGNEAAAENRLLREKIDNLRKERLVFDGVNKKAQADLVNIKNEMADIVAQSNAAYEDRDKIRLDIAALKNGVEKEAVDFEREWKELGDVLEKDKKMQEFFKLKEKVAADKASEIMLLQQVSSLNKAAARGPAPSQRVMATQLQAQSQVQSYEEAFEKIKDATGVSDIDQLVNQFISSEDQNFSLFNYANELQNEVERLEDNVASLRHELEKHRKADASTDSQRRKVLTELESEVAKAEAKDEEFKKLYETANDRVNEIFKGVDRLFSRIGCSEAQLGEMLGGQGITQSNLTQYLGAIEQRTGELLVELQVAQKNERLDEDNIRQLFVQEGEEHEEEELMEGGGLMDQMGSLGLAGSEGSGGSEEADDSEEEEDAIAKTIDPPVEQESDAPLSEEVSDPDEPQPPTTDSNE